MMLIVTALALLGLAVGSFLNVVIARVPVGESIVNPPSHCPRCAMTINRRHNVPLLGWLVLRGRCHSCALPISVRYPAVEIVTSVGFALAAVHAGQTGSFTAVPALTVAVAATVVAVMIDADGDAPRLTAPLYALAIAAVGFGTVLDGSTDTLGFAVLVGGMTATTCWLIAAIDTTTQKFGPVRRSAATAAATGAIAWPLPLSASLVASGVLLGCAALVAAVRAVNVPQPVTVPQPA